LQSIASEEPGAARIDQQEVEVVKQGLPNTSRQPVEAPAVLESTRAAGERDDRARRPRRRSCGGATGTAICKLPGIGIRTIERHRERAAGGPGRARARRAAGRSPNRQPAATRGRTSNAIRLGEGQPLIGSTLLPDRYTDRRKASRSGLPGLALDQLHRVAPQGRVGTTGAPAPRPRDLALRARPRASRGRARRASISPRSTPNATCSLACGSVRPGRIGLERSTSRPRRSAARPPSSSRKAARPPRRGGAESRARPSASR